MASTKKEVEVLVSCIPATAGAATCGSFLPKENSLVFKRPGSSVAPKQYRVSAVADRNDTKAIFRALQPQISSAVTEGINLSIFTHGAKGSGKTEGLFHTDRGIAWPISAYIFDRLATVGSASQTSRCLVTVSVVAIDANTEKAVDLLTGQTLPRIREDKQTGFYMDSQLQLVVYSNKDLVQALRLARKRLESNSNSHTLTTIRVQRETPSGDMLTSDIQIADLQGVEKPVAAKGRKPKPDKTVRAFLRVVDSLCPAPDAKAKAKRKKHVPYRDSKLTRLTKSGLGGNGMGVFWTYVDFAETSFAASDAQMSLSAQVGSIRNQPEPRVFNLAAAVKAETDKAKSLLSKVMPDATSLPTSASIKLDMESPLELVDLRNVLAELERLGEISWKPLLDISAEYKEAYPGGGWDAPAALLSKADASPAVAASAADKELDMAELEAIVADADITPPKTTTHAKVTDIKPSTPSQAEVDSILRGEEAL